MILQWHTKEAVSVVKELMWKQLEEKQDGDGVLQVRRQEKGKEFKLSLSRSQELDLEIYHRV